MSKPTTGLCSEGMLSVSAAAEFLSMSRTTLYSMMDAGQLPYVLIGHRRLIPRKAMIALAEKSLVSGGSAK